jgi:predicted transcriptional regulator
LRYRRRFEIIADILRVAGHGSKKTKIMYFANLSYLLLKKYLDDTLRVGFLKFDGEGYAVTDLGQAFLERFSEFSSRSVRVRRDVASLSSEEDMLNRMCRPKKAKTGKSRGCRRNGIAPLQ